MPLIKSKSKSAFKANVKELVDTYKENGNIGTSKPKSKAKAVAQAVAISYKLKDRAKKKK